jgi:hypothetical protein
MKKTTFPIIGKLLTGLAVLVFIILFILVAVSSFHNPQASSSVYPGPIEIQATSSSLSAEALCDQWFSYRKELPEDKRRMAEEEFKNCVNARTTPSPVSAIKPIPGAPPVGKYTFAAFKRIAGSGTLLESSFSPLNSTYRICNQWLADINDYHAIVYAGGRQSDTAGGSALLNDLSWPGMLVVSVTDSKGNYLANLGGTYWTPANEGPVRIIDANGTTLILTAKNGTSFIFDVVKRQYLSKEPGPIVNRSIGVGTLVESEITPYLVEGYEFINYWYYDKKGLGRISIMAGREAEKPRTGVLVVIVSPLSDSSGIIQATVFETVLSDGALRIVDANGEKTTLVSENDLVYKFDVTSQQFVLLPSGSDPILASPLGAKISSNPGVGLLAGTPTPTVTSLPQPTRTPLPTYNPYP